ncbi:MAG: hypothetical protein KME29_01605 [Calothrix sp. FI2-JRJ7]|jgi:hypothetical protein|nr:hypothetical protein [Calothrix sp. FI2-JRJ7]
MTHFGIICPAATGHLNPMTTLGYELRSKIKQIVVEVHNLDNRIERIKALLQINGLNKITIEQGPIFQSSNIYTFILIDNNYRLCLVSFRKSPFLMA